MKLKDELQLLRAAAHSYDAVENHNDCLALIQRGSPYDLAFFTELSDARWLPSLQATGVFANVPTTFTRGEVTYYARHVALFGLANLAQTAAADVVVILESLDIPENPQVHDQIMRIISAINDLSLAPRLVLVLTRLFEIRSNSEWLWLDDILVKWLNGDARGPCFDVVTAFLRSIATDTREHAGGQVWQVAELDRKIISRLAEAEPANTARLLFDVLRMRASTERTKREGSRDAGSSIEENDLDFDSPSTYWLEQFGAASIGSHDFESTLAQRLYKIGRTIYEAKREATIDEFDQMLRSDRWHLFRRMRWQLYADFPGLSLAFARHDALERIPHLGELSHGYELALMLEIHATFHGSAFLNQEEVQTFADAIFASPTEQDTSAEATARRARFQRRQLYPIRELLTGDALQKFRQVSADTPPLIPENYKPFSSWGEARAIEHVSPVTRDDLAKMTDPELWTFLNNWIPSRASWDRSKWWVEENVGALGIRFAELLESQPSRFRAEDAWWRNIRRPEILHKPLDRATERLEKIAANKDIALPTAAEWSNWFGLAKWITNRRSAAALEKQDAESSPSSDWNWPGIVVVKFLRAALRIEDSGSFHADIAELLRRLVQDPDPTLTKKDKPRVSDWLTTGINSVRGTAVEGLLDLASAQKRDTRIGHAESWIFEFISARLLLADESPAVFAVLGAHLRLAIHLFQEQLKSEAQLLLPANRLDYRDSLLMAHVLYDGPMAAIVDTLPELPSAALECLARVAEQHEQQRQFGSNLGTHLSFYYWNEVFPDQRTADSVIDRFFAVAKAQVRANTIGQIARIFAQSPRVMEHARLYRRTMNLWDRRFSHIEAAIDADRSTPSEFYEELTEFLRWLDCECFDLDWRFDRTLKAIQRMEKPPRSYTLIETLNRLASTPETLDKTIIILHAAISRPSGEIMWGYQEEKLKPLLEKGLASRNADTVRLSEETQERLLREGFLEFLNMTARPGAVVS
jgi:hypothetical protein